jgi:hypothetical protein
MRGWGRNAISMSLAEPALPPSTTELESEPPLHESNDQALIDYNEKHLES